VKRLPLRIALAIATTALSLGIGEIVVRLLGAAPGFAAIPFGQYLTSDDPELLWGPRPGAESVNSAGLRGAEVAAEKTRPRLLVLGDSITWGIELADDETIPVRLQARLAEAGHEVEVLNGGVSGYNTIQEARRLELLAPRLDPDHVVLLFCINDVDPLDGLPEGIHRFARRDDAAEALQLVHGARLQSRLQRKLMSRSHLYRLLHETLVQRPKPKTAGNRPDDDIVLDVVAAGLNRIAAVATKHGFEVTVVTVPVLKDLGPDYPHLRLHADVLALARERGFDTLDLLPITIEAVREEPRMLSLPGDPLHPNAEGAALFAEAIAERWSERHARGHGE
jgi:lysophospholipase L1-like esterase